MRCSICALGLGLIVMLPVAQAQVPLANFVNYEIAPIHALTMSPDGNVLAAVNTPDMRVELFTLDAGGPQKWVSIAVGMEPTSVRFRSNDELWVVNNVSDTISVISISEQRVTATLATLNDPYDVVFAGSPQRAFVSCGFPHTLQVFNPANLAAAPSNIVLQGNNPRALAVSPDGTKVYVAFFHSGNRTTILSGGVSAPGSNIANFPPDIVTNNAGPHSGVNPPPNAGTVFNPLRNTAAGTPPKVSLIVRQDSSGVWRDDTGANWTPFVSGASATQSGRYPGWTVLDHDLAVVDANSLSVNYISDLMNICMAVDVNPASGQVTVVGTEAHNEIRFEPVIQAEFIDVVAATANPLTFQATSHTDLNADLVAQFTGTQLSPTLRATALGDPRAIKWSADGAVGYIAGMGSNNVVKIDGSGQRIGSAIPVRPGPVGLALDEARGKLYVQNRFHGSISVVDLSSNTETSLVSYFDPTPTVIRTGRKHLYDTQHSSAIGQIACASCHVDGRMDRLSWDLGNPAGNKVLLSSRTLNTSISGGATMTDFHPMKGPLLTQTLQDIIDHEPLHWRGDRFGIEEFNDAFHELQGRATVLTNAEMGEFKAFLATLHFPPNPFRNIDNTLPTSLNLGGHFATGRFSLEAGAPLPAGNAVSGLAQYRNQVNRLDRGNIACVTCHTLPGGDSTDRVFSNNVWQLIPRGPNNENQLVLMGVSDVAPPVQNTFKVPHLRNIFERVGFNVRPGTSSLHGFGHGHDGSTPSITDFLNLSAFFFISDQQIANMVALMMSWSGSDFRDNSGNLIVNNGTVQLEPPGVFSKDSHAGVGQQETITSPTHSQTRLNSMVAAVNASTRVQLIAKTQGGGHPRGYLLQGGNFLPDHPTESAVSQAALVANTGSGKSVTFTIVPAGTGQRLGRDRDLDGFMDYQELLNCTDPDDPSSFGSSNVCSSLVASHAVHSSWSGGGSSVDAGKTGHLANGTPTTLGLVNLTNSAAGLNGMEIEVAGLANPGGVQIGDFTFRMSPQGAFSESANPPSVWAAAPAPSSVVVTPGSPDRIVFTWPNGSITNRWLQITVRATSRTGLPSDQVLYIGHLCGEVTGAADGVYTVSFADITPIRAAVSQVVPASSVLDINKDGLVSFADITAMRSSVSTQLTNITVQ
ncbi:MAG: hypothetical protein KF752_04800 [Pirellulaceae bacterium]|nr:hypothetical protein [Pirellulaceae bacterium]